MAAAHGIQWPDLQTPPINLWVMPQWRRGGDKAAARPAPQHRAAAAAQLIDRHLALLAARAGSYNGGSNGNQD